MKKRPDSNLIRRNNTKHNRFQDVEREKKVAIIEKCVLQEENKRCNPTRSTGFHFHDIRKRDLI